jgi:NAD(P)-dependent dehydrogenase (short-subunit alcohol dehydrogenase family)
MTKSEANQIGISEEAYMEGARELHPLGLGKPMDVAYLDLFLASDESIWITESEFNVDEGFTSQ